MDIRWKHPFTAMASGPTGCGKSYFVRELLKNQARVIDTQLKETIWCYGEWQSLYDELQDIVVFHKGILKDLPDRKSVV